MDGDLTMRQAAAVRLERKLAGVEVNWKSGHASFQTDGGKVFCFVTRDGRLAVKLPPVRIKPLIESGEGVLLRMGQRTMREWAVISEDASTALHLLSEAKVYVESLPNSERQTKPGAKNAAAKKAAGKTEHPKF